MPMTSTPPARPPSPSEAARVRSAVGSGTGMRSAIIAAAISITFAIAKVSHGFVLTSPNMWPLSAARRPSDE